MHGEIGIPTRFYRILDKCVVCFSREVWEEVCRRGFQTLTQHKNDSFPTLFKTRELLLWPLFGFFWYKELSNLTELSKLTPWYLACARLSDSIVRTY